MLKLVVILVQALLLLTHLVLQVFQSSLKFSYSLFLSLQLGSQVLNLLIRLLQLVPDDNYRLLITLILILVSVFRILPLYVLRYLARKVALFACFLGAFLVFAINLLLLIV